LNIFLKNNILKNNYNYSNIVYNITTSLPVLQYSIIMLVSIPACKQATCHFDSLTVEAYHEKANEN
jgi:hypothetical protein